MAAIATSVAIEETGGVIVGGHFVRRLEVAGRSYEGSSGWAGFVVRCDSEGNVASVRILRSTGHAFVVAVAADPSGGVVVAGSFDSTLDIDGVRLHAVDDGDGYLASFDRAGAYRWSRRLAGSAMSATDGVRELAIDGSGNVFAAGRFRGHLELESRTIESGFWDDIVLVSCTRAGKLRWLRGLGGDGFDEPTDLAIDGDDLVVTGGFQGTLELRGRVIESAGGSDGFIARYALGGWERWFLAFGDSDGDRIYATTPVGRGIAVFGGAFRGEPAIGDVRVRGAGGVVAALSRNGGHVWASALPPIGIASLRPLPDGGLVLGGDFSGEIALAGGLVRSAGGGDGLIVGLSDRGEPAWVESFGGAGDDAVTSTVVLADDRIAVTGVFGGPGDLLGEAFPVAGESSGFLIQLAR